MAEVRDWQWARDRAKLWTNADSTQTHQDFADADWKILIQDEYEERVNHAKAYRSPDYFLTTTELTWPASQVTYNLMGSPIENGEIYSIRDLTSDETSEGVDITKFLIVRSSNVLVWPNDGPSSDRSLRVVLLAHPEELKNDVAPLLIPPHLMNLLAVGAAIRAREIQDEQAPNAWYTRRNDLTMQYDKWLVSRFKSLPPTVRNTTGESVNTLPSVTVEPLSSFGPFGY